MSKNLQERTTETEVFQDMDNFDLLNDSSTFALSLRLQFPKFAKGFTSSDFEPFVRLHVGEDNLVSLGRLSFPNEWQMQVKCKEVRESLIRMGKTKINTRTCWISPLSQSEVRGFIHWIPTAVHNRKLEEILRQHGEVLLLENQKQKKWTLPNVQSDSRYFALYLKSGKTMDDVPHFIRVNDYYGLITIRGRNPACFHCKELGHRKTECKFYRERISDYSMRPAGSARPRFKPRGKRHNPGKKAAKKAVDREVQTDEVELDETELVSAAGVPEISAGAVGGPATEVAAGVEVPAGVAVKQKVPAASASTQAGAGKHSERTQPATQFANSKAKGQKKKHWTEQILEQLDALVDKSDSDLAKTEESIPKGNVSATGGNKEKEAKGAQAAARSSKPKKSKALSLGQIEDDFKEVPVIDVAELVTKHVSGIEALEASFKALRNEENISSVDGNEDTKVLPPKEGNVSTTEDSKEKEVLPAKEGNADENNFGDILAQDMDCLSLKDGKSAEGKKKRKKRKKKKNVEVGTSAVPSDFL